MKNALTTVAICAEDEHLAQQIRELLHGDSLRVLALGVTVADLAASSPQPGVVVLQVHGATRRAKAIKSARATVPDAPIIVVGRATKGHEVRSAIEAGAAGFVFEEELAATLALTIHVTRAGQVAVPRRERRQVERPTLSAREKQILGLVVMGYMNCEIADRLYLAESTVKSHLSSAFSKLGVRSRNEAVDLILDGEDGLGRGILAITGDVAGDAGAAVSSPAA